MAYQHMVIKTRESKIQGHLDKWGPRGFRLVGCLRRGEMRVTLILEASLCN